MADVSTEKSRRPHLPRWMTRQRTATPSLARRLWVIVVLLIVGISLIGIRLVDLQVIRSQTLADTAMEFRSRTYRLPAERGRILDSQGRILVQSRQRYNVGINQNLVPEYVDRDSSGKIVGRGVTRAAHNLAPLLDMDEARLAGLLYGGKEKTTWRYLVKDISPEEWRKINSFRIPGIEPEAFMRREYPNGAMAASVLGFIGEDGEGNFGGQAGIERSMDEKLNGKMVH